jgi:hypothetical protein
MSVVVSPTLTLTVDKTAASPGETVVLSGYLKISKESGDLNQDGLIDYLDIFRVIRAFGSYPGHPKWDPECDLNKDNIVDYLDIVKVARAFGQWVRGKNVTIYVSSNGVDWTPITSLRVGDDGAYTYPYTVPTDTPTSSTLYFMSYFPGGVF